MVAAADKGKKQKVVERESESEDSERVLLSVEKLQDIQEELEKINEKASDEVLALEQKYNGIRKPVYDKRNEVINTIPDFWLTAILNHPALGDLFSDEDQKIFRYLSSLEVDDYTDVKTGYSISFVFKPNPFFEDTKLTKTFTFLDEGATKVTATNIKWKEGMGLANGVANEKKGNKRPPADESFFTWFTDTEFKNDEDFQDEIADIIKDDLWPNPLSYFNNQIDEDDLEVEEGDEEEDGSGSEEDDGGEDE